MSGEQERLYARAEVLDETGELAQAVAEVLTGARGAGVDPRAVISLTAAVQTLDPGAGTSYTAGSRKDRQDGSGYGSDGEFLEALSDAEDQVREHLREVKTLQEQLVVALDRAQQDLGQARRDLEAARAALAAASAMGTRQPCDGCHSARAAAIAAAEAAIAEAEARIADARRRTGICEAAADILGPLAERLARVLAQLRTVPQDLGEVYELIYEFVRRGGKLPRHARWIEGDRAHVSTSGLDASRPRLRLPGRRARQLSRRPGTRRAPRGDLPHAGRRGPGEPGVHHPRRLIGCAAGRRPVPRPRHRPARAATGRRCGPGRHPGRADRLRRPRPARHRPRGGAAGRRRRRGRVR